MLNQRGIIGVFSAFYTQVEDVLIFSSQPAALFSNSPFLENMDVGAAAKARGPTRASGCLRKARAYSDTTNGEKLLENKEVFF